MELPHPRDRQERRPQALPKRRVPPILQPLLRGLLPARRSGLQRLTPSHADALRVRGSPRRLGGQSGRAHYKKRDFAYAGLIRCGRCGQSVTAEAQPGRHGRGRWVYYHCGNAKGTCSKRSIREDVLEERLDRCLAQITITAEFKEIVQDALEKWIAQEFGSQEAQYGQQLRALADGEKMLNELVEMRLRRLLTDEQFQAKQRELTADVSRLRLQLGRLQERLDHTREVIHNALDFRERAREQFLIGDLAKRREIARALGVRYVFDEGDVFIEMNPLLLPMQTPENQNFEPLEIGFESAKKTFSDEKVPFGWPGGTEYSVLLRTCPTWLQVFQLVWDNSIFFAQSTTGSW